MSLKLKMMLKLLTLSLALMLAACSSPRQAAVTPVEKVDAPAFYHDEAHHLMLRVDPEAGDGTIGRYLDYREEHPYMAYRFYQEEVLGLATAFDRQVYTLQDIRATGGQVQLIDRPEPVYPEKKPLYGRILIVEVSMIVGPDGTVEYAELANIRRNAEEPESTISTALSGEIPKWTAPGVHELDLPYIRNSIRNATGYRFEPILHDGLPVRFNVIVSYLYNADRM